LTFPLRPGESQQNIVIIVAAALEACLFCFFCLALS
jgi:hypothetical protein